MASGYYDFSGAFGNLNSSIDGVRKRWDQNEQKRTLAELGQQVQSGNFDGAAQKAFALGDPGTGLGILKLGQAAKQQALQQEASRSFLSGLGGGGPAPQPTAAAPFSVGSPNEIESRFIGGVRQAGLTNPVGLGAVAAYGRAESGFSPRNANRTWSDPSESGQAGQAGGIMSWRADRLRNLYSFAQQRGEQPGNISPETQAMFLAQEDPTLIPKLQAARTPEEANGIMAQAWRFAGYNRPGGENARRLAMTQHYASRFGQQPAAQPVQVAETEADVQRLEAQQAAQQAAPVQVAQAPGPQADMPAPGAAPAQGYAIPQGAGSDIPPNDPAPRLSTQALMAAQANPNLPQAQREMAKAIVERRLRYSDENSPIKTENLRLQNEKLRRDIDGVLTPEQEAQKIRLAQAGRTQINNTNTYDAKGETKFNEALGAAQAKRWNGYIEEGDLAQNRLADIQTLRESSRRLGSQGSQANLKSMIGPYAESLGIKIDGLSDIQLYESITNRLAPQLRAPGSGSTSDIEFKGFMRAIGPLSNTPAAREMILDTFEAASRNDLARSAIASRLAAGEINRGQAEKEIRALPNPLDGFREFRKQNPDLVGQAIKEAGMRNSAEKRDPVKVASPEEARKLPSGTRIILPDGRPGQVP